MKLLKLGAVTNTLRLRIGWRKGLFYLVVLLALVASIENWFLYFQNQRYVAQVAQSVIQQAQANDPRARVMALRNYLQTHVSYHGAPHDDRPFFRASAAETLQSGLGYCGEVSRTFIKMAHAIGIRAQRINLYGTSASHVVAEAELSENERVIVDAQNPPQVPELEPLEKTMLRPLYNDYSTLNLRRLHLDWIFRRVKLEMGIWNYWLESPHALKALSWLALAVTLLSLRFIALMAPRLVRTILTRHGWVQLSDLDAQQAKAAGYSA